MSNGERLLNRIQVVVYLETKTVRLRFEKATLAQAYFDSISPRKKTSAQLNGRDLHLVLPKTVIELEARLTLGVTDKGEEHSTSGMWPHWIT